MFRSKRARRPMIILALVGALLSLSACNNDDESAGSGAGVPQQFTIAGTVSGLASGQSVVLDDNGANPLTVSANGALSFSSPVNANASYGVTVATQPKGQVCTVSNGSGAGVTANISNVTVACSTDTYTISGSISGLAGAARVVLDNNGADALTLSANGPLSFTTPVAYNGSYLVTVATQPSGATCTVSKGSGAGVTANISNVSVTCSSNTYAIGGTVTGLATSTQVTLDDNGGDPLTVTANGAFTFSTQVVAQGAYSVTVGTQPTGQTCTVISGSSTGVLTNVSDVAVTCSTDAYTIGGTVSGLAGATQVTLDNNGANPLILAANGSFTFTTPAAYGGAYTVTVGTQPNGQFCAVLMGSASDVTANVTNVSISCSTNPVSFTTAVTTTWTVPTGVSSIQILATGGGGGGAGLSGTNGGQPGGTGAVVSSTLSVTAGQVLNLVVGGGGGGGTNGPSSGGGGYSCGAGGGGGGSSNVDAGDAQQVIAGGGGGGGACQGATGGGGNGGGSGGAGGSGATVNGTTGGSGGSGGIGGLGGNLMGMIVGVSGASGSGGAGGGGGGNGSLIPGGAFGSGVGPGTGGGNPSCCAGGGGGGYGGGGTGIEGTGGGAGGSIGPAGTTYAPASNGGATGVNGADGSIVITMQ